ncbi:hypothetical protein BS78_10G222200 [Paspalum vaginatum]|nr:hypothetical protein BS78_10G222200 [Paspalum vaginatum]
MAAAALSPAVDAAVSLLVKDLGSLQIQEPLMGDPMLLKASLSPLSAATTVKQATVVTPLFIDTHNPRSLVQPRGGGGGGGGGEPESPPLVLGVNAEHAFLPQGLLDSPPPEPAGTELDVFLANFSAAPTAPLLPSPLVQVTAVGGEPALDPQPDAAAPELPHPPQPPVPPQLAAPAPQAPAPPLGPPHIVPVLEVELETPRRSKRLADKPSARLASVKKA